MTFNIENVITILHSSKNIEHTLANTYRKVKYPFNRRGVNTRNLPLFNKELYKLIIERRYLPSVKEFENYYLNLYLTRPTNKVALQYHANIAYKSLVTDLHFYFILKESCLFDDVTIDYLYDLEAKTDILLSKNDKQIGIQLFSGDENYRISKEKSIQNLHLSYKLLLYNLQDNPERKKEISSVDGSNITLYGELDAQYLAEYLHKSPKINFNKLVKEQDSIDRFTLLENIPKNTSSIDDKYVKYSFIYVGPYSEKIDKFINKLFKEGKKVYHYFLNKSDLTFIAIDGDTFILNKQKVDSKMAFNILEKMGNNLQSFNIHQYKIEHASPTQNIAVNAGAGSGKTTTLVSRILFLLFTKQIKSLQEIVMITFTNEAATNMKEALEKRLEELYRQTGSEVHFNYLQQVNSMKIVTIPSFAKDIIKQFSHYIGLSTNINITDMVVERRRILEDCLDTTLKEDSVNPFGSLDYFKIIKFLENVWDKFEQKGIVENELSDYLKHNQVNDTLKRVVAKIIRDADQEFTNFKFNEDFLTVSDLTRFLKLLIERNVPLHELNQTYKYLLVDEFQDTDIAQIQFIATIAAKANLYLTVVGDTKQSVYRFRGADSTAFTVLNDYLKELDKNKQLYTYHLIENFRSSKELIIEMENIFSSWRKSKLLPSNEQPMYSRQENLVDKKHIFQLYNDEFTIEHLLEEYELLPPKKDKPSVLAVLVRNNREAEAIGKMLKEHENAPECDVRTDGTLYISKAARDLGVLLHSWLYANSDKISRIQSLFSLSYTAFSVPKKDIHFNLQRIRNNEYTITSDEIKFIIPEMWYKALDLMKEKPMLPIIQEFIAQSDFRTNLAKKGYKNLEILQYELNLEKILAEIYTQFNNNSSIIQIYDWLRLQILTNRESDEAEIEESSFNDNYIRIMTVHKSKGLQFHTVIIPNPNNPFIRHENAITKDVIVQINEENQLEFGWKYLDQSSNFEDITTNYPDLRTLEDEELRREEARILYVAMTRAMQSLKIYGLSKVKRRATIPNTWGELLKM